MIQLACREESARPMDFGYSEEQEILRESARQFLAQEQPLTRVRQLAEMAEGFDRKLFARAAELGWCGLLVPEEHGGVGLGVVDVAALAEELGRALHPGPELSIAAAAGVIAEFGSEAQRAVLLPKLAAGESVAALAVSEMGGDWSPAAFRVAAAASADGGRLLSGTKHLVVDGPGADALLVAATGPQGTELLWVPASTPGLSRRRHASLDLARPLAEVRFEEARVGAECVLAGDGAAALERLLQIGCALQCAESVGVLERLLEMTVAYASQRIQFDRPIGSFQVIRHKSADMKIQLEAARTAAHYAALAVGDRLPDAAEAVAVAKSVVGDAAHFIAGEALQIHGGLGFTWEQDLHLYFRRAKSNELLLGSAAFHRERLCQIGAAG